MAADLDAVVLDVLHHLWTTMPTANPAVESAARELLLDTLGCAISAVAEPEIDALFRQFAAADPGTIRFPGVAYRPSASGFAYAFAASACWHEACEGLAVAHGRPGLHAIPAVLAQALMQDLKLGALLHAIVAGYEVGGRLGMICRIRPGMHVDGTWGSFGAAAAVCHLAGASPEVTMAALNHVACHMPFSLYWPITVGSVARNAYAGHGATHGMAAAMATLAGLGGPAGSIGEMGRLALGVGETMPDVPGPGTSLLLSGYLKPYPAVRHVHYAVAAAERWGAGRPDDITAIRLHVYPEALTYCANRVPSTAIQAQFSLSYATARTLRHGTLDPTAYAAASLADPLTRRLEAMVEIVPDFDANRRGCTLEVTAAGTVWTRTVDQVPGDEGMPMTRTQVLDKFHAYADAVIGRHHASTIANRLLNGSLDAPLNLLP